jgi:hypothetical protein
MKRFFVAHLVIMFFAAVLFISDAHAFGIGLFYQYGGGSSNWTMEYDENYYNGSYHDDWSEDYDGDKTRKAFGFVLDTTIARDMLFNYRLQIGYETWEDEVDDFDTFDMDGITMTHDFGFGVLRTPYVRLWLGPELKFAYTTGSLDSDEHVDVYSLTYGIGPVMGANFNIGPTVTLGIKGGYLFQGFVGTVDNDRYSTYENDFDFHGHTDELYFDICILFRFGDFF